MKFLFLLSGLHPELPLAELKAVLSIKTRFKVVKKDKRVVIIEIKQKEVIKNLLERLTLTYGVFEFLGCCKINDLLKTVKQLKYDFNIPFRIRVHSLGFKKDSKELEKKIANIIWKKIKECGKKPKVDLENPKTSFEAFLTENKAYFGVKIAELDRKQFFKRSPKKRPFIRPVTMDPRIARVMVNLARTKKGEKILDPFCGTGGILIEAGLIGMKIYGVDLDLEMVNGCKKNLNYFGIKGKIIQGDARELDKIFKENYFDGIITDPPYGIAASLKGSERMDLYEKSLNTMEKVLKPKKYLVIVTPKYINLKTKMQLIEIYEEKIHRSLTRKIWVFKK